MNYRFLQALQMELNNLSMLNNSKRSKILTATHIKLAKMKLKVTLTLSTRILLLINQLLLRNLAVII